VGYEPVEWFNGGLFDTDEALPLEPQDAALVLQAARLDWSEIDPSIFGTLFERGLDPDKRSQLGAHYTDRDKIMMLVEPVVIRPLQTEWESIKAQIAQEMEKYQKAKAASTRTRAWNAARALYNRFLNRLKQVRVLDPACGSGNFLYLAILALKDLEHKANLDAEALGLERQFPSIGPECVKGIEINPYAAELARVTVWIGEIQWMRRNGFDVERKPILRPLDTIECRDAVLNQDGSEEEWPEAEFIIGNPPFLGNKRMISVLGEDYTGSLRRAYRGRVPGGADLVLFWFEKARAAIEAGTVQRAGLVGTNSIRGGENRKVLAHILDSGTIFEAWSDEPWVVEGAAVRVSLVCFTKATETGEALYLDGEPVVEIFPDLTARDITTGIDLTNVNRLLSNFTRAFQGPVKVGPFDIPGELARRFLQMPINPNGRPNADVVKPWANGMDITRRPSDTWIIDFGDMTEAEACFYEAPFEYVRVTVKPLRDKNRRARRQMKWWQHGETVPGLRDAVTGLPRFIITPRLAKHRLFAWTPARLLPDCQLVAIAREDDTTFGILHSRLHEIWALRLGTSLEDRPRYTSSTTFETFPFPEGLTPDISAVEYASDPRAQKIAAASKRLDDLAITG
jgi:type II restriction/modification system DNA methylase subunit YeeA